MSDEIKEIQSYDESQIDLTHPQPLLKLSLAAIV